MFLVSILNYFGLLCQAYAWGFDLRSWQRHLNPLTWPEILRQFGLSAGFGPQMKKRNVDQAYLRDDNEVVAFFFGSSFFFSCSNCSPIVTHGPGFVIHCGWVMQAMKA